MNIKKRLKKFNHKLNKSISKNRFVSIIYVNVLPIIKYFYFKEERKLVSGSSIPISDNNSVLFFTSHKCASTLINNILTDVSILNNLIPIRLANFLPGAGRDKSLFNQKFLNSAFKDKGYYYGAFRMLYDIPHLEKYKIILVLRDPRDVLTSHYFSTAFNHPLARNKTILERDLALNMSIDEYVLKYSDSFLKVYEDYMTKLSGLSNVLFLKYEDMITNFEPWINRLALHINVDPNSSVIQNYISQTSFVVTKEDKNSFVRNIKSGDHLNKLSPETIKILNERFDKVLKFYGY